MNTAAFMKENASVPTIWLLHAFGDDRSAWDALIGTNILAGCRVVTVTAAGHGGSRLRRPRHLEAMACDIGELIGKNNTPAILVGHSMGGVLATLVAEAGWPHVVGVVHIEGNLTLADCLLSEKAARSADIQRWVDQTSRRYADTRPRFAAALRRANPEQLRLAAEDLVRLSRDAGIGRRFAALRLPTVYVGGSTVPADTERFATANSVEIARIPGAGHWVMEDQPAETATVIQRFVEAIPVPGPTTGGRLGRRSRR